MSDDDDKIVTPEDLAAELPSDVEWYTPQEVCSLFRVDSRTVVRWETSGKLAENNVHIVRTLGNHRRYNKEDIDRLYYSLNPRKEIDEQGS